MRIRFTLPAAQQRTHPRLHPREDGIVAAGPNARFHLTPHPTRPRFTSRGLIANLAGSLTLMRDSSSELPRQPSPPPQYTQPWARVVTHLGLGLIAKPPAQLDTADRPQKGAPSWRVDACDLMAGPVTDRHRSPRESSFSGAALDPGQAWLEGRQGLSREPRRTPPDWASGHRPPARSRGIPAAETDTLGKHPGLTGTETIKHSAKAGSLLPQLATCTRPGCERARADHTPEVTAAEAMQRPETPRPETPSNRGQSALQAAQHQFSSNLTRQAPPPLASGSDQQQVAVIVDDLPYDPHHAFHQWPGLQLAGDHRGIGVKFAPAGVHNFAAAEPLPQRR